MRAMDSENLTGFVTKFVVALMGYNSEESIEGTRQKIYGLARKLLIGPMEGPQSKRKWDDFAKEVAACTKNNNKLDEQEVKDVLLAYVNRNID